jgi:hypothetical protein
MSLHDIELCATCNEPRHRHRPGLIEHTFAEPIDLAERDRAFIASLCTKPVAELRRMLSSVRHEWMWWCVTRAIDKKVSPK